MIDLTKQIIEAKKIELNDGDVLIIIFSNKSGDPEDFQEQFMETFSTLCGEKDVTCIFLPEDIKVNKMNKEATIATLEQIIETLRA